MHKPNPFVDDALEMAITNCIVNVKNSLDAHMCVYDKLDGVRTTSYDEAISLAATMRTAYEAASQVLQFVELAKITSSNMVEKHALSVKLCKKFIADCHHNNIIIDHPKCDAVKAGVGVVKFLQALHGVLAEVTPDAHRYQHAKTFLNYNQYCHADDEKVVALVPSLIARGGAFLQSTRGTTRQERVPSIRSRGMQEARPPILTGGN